MWSLHNLRFQITEKDKGALTTLVSLNVLFRIEISGVSFTYALWSHIKEKNLQFMLFEAKSLKLESKMYSVKVT